MRLRKARGRPASYNLMPDGARKEPGAHGPPTPRGCSKWGWRPGKVLPLPVSLQLTFHSVTKVLSWLTNKALLG